MIALQALKLVAALLCLKARLTKGGAFLCASLVSEAGRAAFRAMREGFPKPYAGLGFVLWLPDPALVLLLPAVLLGTVTSWKAGAFLWATSFAFVAWSYPELRGERLMAAYEALFLVVDLAVAGWVVWQSFTRKLVPDEGVVMLLALSGIAGLSLVLKFGAGEWWGAWIPNGVAYGGAGLAAVWRLLLPPGRSRSP